MKALIQRVMNASVSVNGEVISSIEKGMCVLIGISSSDTVEDMEYIVRKLLSVRIFDNKTNSRWKENIIDKNYEMLCVSQFTLYNTWKGNSPDFHKAMSAENSKEFYDKFLEKLRDAYSPDKIKDGQFGAYMQVSIQNDGPVTFEIESPINVRKAKSRSGVQEVPQVDLSKEDELK